MVILFIGLVLALAISLVGLKYIGLHIDNFDRQMEEIAVTNIDLSMLADGRYTGVGRLFLIFARVEVTVENGMIMAIEIMEHGNCRCAGAEGIIEHVIAGQTLKAGTISDDSYSCKVILKAIVNALENAAKGSAR